MDIGNHISSVDTTHNSNRVNTDNLAHASGDQGVHSSSDLAPSARFTPPSTAHGSHSPDSSDAHSHHPDVTDDELELKEWSVRICFDASELGISFALLIFLGEVPDDPADWRGSSHFIGAHYGIVSGAPDRHRDDNPKSEGFVQLNDGIARLSGLDSFEPDVVVPYLTRALQWRIQRTDREPADPSDLPSLEIEVYCTPLSMPPGEMFPIPGKPRLYPEITEGRL